LEKSTGKENKITLNTYTGRLSKDEIERMMKDAEMYRAENRNQMQNDSCKNSLRSHCLDMKSPVEDQKLKYKIQGGWKVSRL
jgi:L1 cell adhesion molecule like protein